MKLMPAPVLAAVLMLAGCGGGDVAWCFGSGSGTVSVGFNTDSCPPEAQAGTGQLPVDIQEIS